MGHLLDLDDVRRAAETIAPHLPPTPLRRSALDVPGEALWLKLECWQPTGSFKVRGALNLMASLRGEERARGVVAASAGNHALGVAFAAERLGGAVRATLFVPRSAPRAKVDKLRRFPVEVIEVGVTYDEADGAARAFEHSSGAVYVHAFEDPRTAAGQGTVGLEIAGSLGEGDVLLVPVGGGGLIAGVATVVKAMRTGVRVVAVQPEASPALRESLRLGRPLLTYPAESTLADGLAGGIGQIVFDHRHLVDDVVSVSEDEIERAIVALLAADQVVAEGSGAVGVAALRAGRVRTEAGRKAVAVVTGGNIDARVLARLLWSRL
jgi:threonine dehydratase